ncbi:MAG: phage tail tape measure protein [Candidatus Sumerlaeales bacterium]|nr:phage tail tape measure protein [Candidatus Sumerlaeales bacterium]
MAEDLKIIIGTELDISGLQSQLDKAKVRLKIDTSGLGQEINSAIQKISKNGAVEIGMTPNMSGIAAGAREAGKQASREIQRAIASGGGVKMPVKIDTAAITKYQSELRKMGIGEDDIARATQALADQNIQVKRMAQSYKSVNEGTEKLARITISGTDELGRQVAVVQQYNVTRKKYLQTETQITSKLNENGEIINKMATDLRTKDIGTIKEMQANKLATFIERIKNADLYTDEMRTTTDELSASLKSAFSDVDMTKFLNQLDVAKTRFATLVEISKGNKPDTRTSNIDTRVSSLNTMLGYEGMNAGTEGITRLRGEMNSLVSAYTELKTKMASVDVNSDEYTELSAQLNTLDKRFLSAAQAAKVFNGTFGSDAKRVNMAEQIEKAKSGLDELARSWSAIKTDSGLSEEFRQLRVQAEGLDEINLNQFNKSVATFKSHVKAAGKDTQSFGDQLKNAASKFGLWITASTIIMQAWRAIRNMSRAVREIDESLTEFNKVADLSNDALSKFTDRAFTAGKALGRTVKEVLDASALFKQSGYDIEESLALAQTSLMMMNVGDGIDTAERASSDLLAALRGFGMEASQAPKILDALNNASNNTAIGFNNLSEGISRVAGTLSQSGTTMAETIGLLVGGFSSLRNIEKVSSGLVMISQRLRAVTEDGDAIDGLKPKLEGAFQELVGVSIQDQNGQLRSTYDLLSDLQGRWDSLTSSQQQYIGSLVSG